MINNEILLCINRYIKNSPGDLLSLGVFNLTKENTMKIYDTYAECKKNHPEKEVVTTGSKWIGDYEHIGKFIPRKDEFGERIISDECWIICNPADYLMSLEEFFESGHEFVDGDKWINRYGRLITINGTANSANERMEGDKNRFVLSAKALEEKVEQVEWKNGDECIVTEIDGSVYKGRYICFDGHVNSHVCQINLSIYHVDESHLKKPETPEQKKEREELEAAYDLYICWHDGKGELTFDEFKKSKGWAEDWIRIVNKTEYRKPE